MPTGEQAGPDVTPPKALNFLQGLRRRGQLENLVRLEAQGAVQGEAQATVREEAQVAAQEAQVAAQEEAQVAVREEEQVAVRAGAQVGQVTGEAWVKRGTGTGPGVNLGMFDSTVMTEMTAVMMMRRRERAMIRVRRTLRRKMQRKSLTMMRTMRWKRWSWFGICPVTLRESRSVSGSQSGGLIWHGGKMDTTRSG
jgi:hypothetical protein